MTFQARSDRLRWHRVRWPVAALAATTALLIVLWLASADDVRGFDAIWLLSWLGFPLVGAFLVVRRPDNRLSWLLAGIGILVPGGAAGQLAAVRSGWPAGPLIVITEAAVVAGIALIPLWILWYPTGRVATGRWIVAERIVLLFAAVLTTYYLVRPGQLGSTEILNPVGGDLLRPLRDSALEVAAGWGVAMLALLALRSLVGRWRRSEAFERQQLKLVVLPLFAFVLAALMSAGFGLLLGDLEHPVADLRLRSQVDARQVSEILGDSVQRTVQPSLIAMWVRS